MLIGTPAAALPRGRQTPSRVRVDDLKALIGRARHSTESFAEALGVNRNTMSSWINRGIPDEAGKVAKVAEALGIDENALRQGRVEPSSTTLTSITQLRPGPSTADPGEPLQWPTPDLRRKFHEGLVQQMNTPTGLTTDVIAALRPTAEALGIWLPDSDD